MSAEPLSNLVELAPKDESPAETIERDVYRFVQSTLSIVGGHDKAAEIMKLDPGDLTRALSPKKTRYLSVEHVMRYGEALAKVSPETAQRFAAAILKPFDLVVFPRVQLTAAERARRLTKKLEAIGSSMGVDLVSMALEEP